MYEIELSGSHETGVCECCGNRSRCVWGYIYKDGDAAAVYYVHWTLGHILDHGANFDLILGLWGAWNVSRGRTGRALRIIKESEIAAASLGIHIARYKVTAFALSAFYAALAGGLFAYLVRYINPESFNVGLSIAFLSMVVIGGLGTIGGSIVGAAFYVIVPELLRGIKDAPGLVFGLLLVVVMVFMPQGLWGMVRRLVWKR